MFEKKKQEKTEQSDEQKKLKPNISVSTTMALNRFEITIINYYLFRF